jgi:hypothetical protein
MNKNNQNLNSSIIEGVLLLLLLLFMCVFENFILTLILFIIIVVLFKVISYEDKNKKLIEDDDDTVLLEDMVDENDLSIDKDCDGHIMVSEVYPLTEEEIVKKILDVDCNFSKENFINFVKEYFILYEKAISCRNVKEIQVYESNSLYNRHKEYVQNLIDSKSISKRSKVVIKGVLLKDFKIEGNSQILVVAITAKCKMAIYKEFAKEDDIAYDDVDKSYIIKFSRSASTITNKDSNTLITNCPNCGAIIKTDDVCHCSYCGTAINSGKFDWVVIDFINLKLTKQKD